MSYEPKEIWKTIIHSERNMRDAMQYLMDDYERLLEFYQTHNLDDGFDDSTWVHVDAVKEEREELEQEIEKLKKENEKLKQELEELKPSPRLPKRTTKRLPKRKALEPKGFDVLEDEIPF